MADTKTRQERWYGTDEEKEEAKKKLARKLRERAKEDAQEEPIAAKDQRQATREAAASGDYAAGTYKPFRPKRVDDEE